jgi:uncharacterized membrane protein YraQ (UPF0718 family)
VRRKRGVNLSILILGVALIALVAVAVFRGGAPLALQGANEGVAILASVAPQLLLGFLLAGFITVLIPSDLVARLLGEESGLLGLVIATGAGMLTPGGPYLQFPLLAAIARSGAATGPVAAYLTAWSLLGANRALVWELPLLGSGFTAARWAVSIATPILIGLLVPMLMRAMHTRITA